MNKIYRWGVGATILSGLLACTPSTNIKQPLTSRPPGKDAVVTRNGAIYQAGQNERPLFEDRHARNVGDVLVIRIVETTSATGKSSSSADHSGSVSATTPVMSGSGTVAGLLNPISVLGSSESELADESSNSNTNVFSGTITVTVIEVLPNGNLLVGGEKQVAINHANEFIRFSGVVNPDNISGSNIVLSNQVADAHIEYKGSTRIDLSTVSSMLSKVFLSVMPF